MSSWAIAPSTPTTIVERGDHEQEARRAVGGRHDQRLGADDAVRPPW